MEDENELFEALANDPEIAAAVEHYNMTCDQNDEEDGCPICVALKALEILMITADTYKAPAFVKQVSRPPEVLGIMARLGAWFSEAQADFFEFLDENTEYDHDHDEEEDEEEE